MSVARWVGRTALWPVRRLLDPRFADINRRLHAARSEIAQESASTRVAVGSVTSNVEQLVGGYTATNVESLSFLGLRLRELEAAVGALSDQFADVSRDRDDVYRTRLARVRETGVAELDDAAATFINHAESHQGFAAERELWLNPPLSLEHRAGDVRLAHVNERIVEVPYALQALRDVPRGAAVLDFGSAESTLSLSLASLGYEVTALDLRSYPFRHPLLTSVASPLEDWDAGDQRFAAVLCVSTVEHVGLGWYGEEAAAPGGDAQAMRRLRDLTEPGAVLVLTVPYGEASVDDRQRRYDRAGLDALIDGWEEVDRRIVEQVDDVTWQPVDESSGDAVALVTARAPRQA